MKALTVGSDVCHSVRFAVWLAAPRITAPIVAADVGITARVPELSDVLPNVPENDAYMRPESVNL
jgi:hypothetical protein